MTREQPMRDRHKQAIDGFGEFAIGFVRDLNHLSERGWGILVEGQRDETALRKLEFLGTIALVSDFRREGARAFGGLKKVIILTDLDREGSVLASRFLKELAHEGFTVSLAERRRLKHASRGLFLHIENLVRFEDRTSLH
ncbi:MAG TPA: toprim domain-containing protein [Nitrososphaerales archaeon]|nr:toprim domain-containing protein [Nitrososphaerales archaeon]